MSIEVKLNIGCGPVQPDGWVNIDNSMRARLASALPFVDKALVAAKLLPHTDFRPSLRPVNLEKRLPWADGTVRAIYAGEVLEHFTRESARQLLAECFRILEPGGVLRVRVPDNARFWRSYLHEYDAARSRPRSEWTMTHTRWTEMFFRDIWTRPRLGSSGHYHKWMYDEISLTLTFESVGFVEVSRMPFLESRISDVQHVEVRDELIVEGIKPS